MSGRQVHDVDIIPDAGAIGRIVIISKNIHALAPSNGNLGNERKQIVRNAVGIFADQAALMSADRIEVTKNPDRPAWVARKNVAQHVFYDEFCPTIGIYRPERMVFGVRKEVG